MATCFDQSCPRFVNSTGNFHLLFPCLAVINGSYPPSHDTPEVQTSATSLRSLLASQRIEPTSHSCFCTMGRTVSRLVLLLTMVATNDAVLAQQFLRAPTEDYQQSPVHKRPYPDPGGLRILAEGGSPSVCHKSGSFLGVGNVDCLHDNLSTAIFLLAVIIIISLLFERFIGAVRRAIACPQLKKIVNRIFEEVMIMGFISMIIFTLNTSGLMKKFHTAFDGDLSDSERLHFYEFFHYIVFLTMIYFILIVLFLLFVGTVVPKFIWELQKTNYKDSDIDEDGDSEDQEENDIFKEQWWDRHSRNREETLMESLSAVSDERFSRREYPSAVSGRQLYRPSGIRARALSGMDLVRGSRAYGLLLQRYQREGWCFMFNLRKQWHLWKSLEILAYNICQNRSGYIYKNPMEMKRLFGIEPAFHSDGSLKPMTYDQYHVLCMRNLLFNISHLHFSAFFVLLVIVVVPVLVPNYDHWIFLGVGGALLLINLIIFFKVLSILRGIVDDRLRVISTADIRRRMTRLEDDAGRNEFVQKKRPSFRVVALSVRAMIRMQMSSLCHRQLHFHDDRFWFNSPLFLLRLFHFATIGQAFYLVWFTLVEWQAVEGRSFYLIPIMMLLPIIAMCIITPMTMPSLVLVMSLTGIFVELSGDSHSRHRPTQTETKTRIRLMRRSYLRSHYTDTDDPASTALAVQDTIRSLDEPVSPASVFLRMYDSPTAAAQHAKMIESSSPRRTCADREEGALQMKRSASGTALCAAEFGDSREQGRTRRSFDLSTYNSSAISSRDLSRKAYTQGNPQRPPARSIPQSIQANDQQPETPRTSTPPISPAFKNYCSKYGGYPDA